MTQSAYAETQPKTSKSKQFGIFLGSPLAVVKAAATLPGVHTKHET
jgi:hypothetical protein